MHVTLSIVIINTHYLNIAQTHHRYSRDIYNKWCNITFTYIF